MKKPTRARLGYARATGERRAATGAVLPCAASRRRRHISPVPLDGVATVPVLRTWNCAVRRELRNRVRAESGPRPVSGLAPMQLPRGLRLLLHDQTQRFVREGSSLQKARLPQAAGRAKDGTRRGAARDGNTRQPSEIGAVPQTGITQLQVERSLRGKRSDPSHGANAAPQALAVPVVKVPERMYSCRRPSTRPASEPPAGGHRTGRRGLTR